MINKPNRQLPIFVKQICLSYDAYIVGSGAAYISGEEGIKANNDWDIIIDPLDWDKFLPFMLDKQFKLNSWGGFKLLSEGKEIDIWPASLHNYIASNKASKIIYKPKGGKLITINE